MPTYEEVLNLAQRLSRVDQARLLKALSVTLPNSIEVEGTDEVVSAEELAESEAALQDYWSGRDLGITPTALKQKLFEGRQIILKQIPSYHSGSDFNTAREAMTHTQQRYRGRTFSDSADLIREDR